MWPRKEQEEGRESVVRGRVTEDVGLPSLWKRRSLTEGIAGGGV